MTTRVVDASALVELLTDGIHAHWVEDQLIARDLAAPAHLDAEVLSAVGRRHQAGHLTTQSAEDAIRRLVRVNRETYSLNGLLLGAWARRDNLRLVDALYVELAAQLDTILITTDRRLARATPLAVAPQPFDEPD